MRPRTFPSGYAHPRPQRSGKATRRRLAVGLTMTLGYANGAFAADTGHTAEKHGGDHPGPAVGLAKQTTEVIVRKDRSDAQRMRDSANPVKVLDTYYARQQARDLGDVRRDVVRRIHALGLGTLLVEVNGFLRKTGNLIVPLADTNGVRYNNVNSARIAGVEGSVKWISPGRHLMLDANATWQDARNISTDTRFAKFNGERIPNRPWFFANGSARFQWRCHPGARRTRQ